MKQIPLTQGKFAIVDDEDYEWLAGFRWHYDDGYAKRNLNKAEKQSGYATIRMHQQILGIMERLPRLKKHMPHIVRPVLSFTANSPVHSHANFPQSL